MHGGTGYAFGEPACFFLLVGQLEWQPPGGFLPVRHGGGGGGGGADAPQIRTLGGADEQQHLPPAVCDDGTH